jgi:hypothetical protein
MIHDKRLTLVWTASGYLDGQLIKNYLESFELKVFTFEESVGTAYGLTTTPLAEVEIYVLNKDAAEATIYLDAFQAKFEDD